jgi:hypothetical protein
MKRLLCCLFLACWQAKALATVIVVAYNQKHICIAADSRDVKEGVFSNHSRKIFQSGNLFLARAGLYETLPGGKSIMERILAGTNQTTNARDSLRALHPALADEFTALMVASKQAGTDFYKEITARKTDEIASVLVCGFLAGKPVVELNYWKLRFTTNGTPFVTGQFEAYSVPASSGPLGLQAIGQTKAIRNALSANPNLVLAFKDDPATLALNLATLELNSIPSADPAQNVGGAIDVLQIDRKQAQWIQKKDECPAIVPYWAEKE